MIDTFTNFPSQAVSDLEKLSKDYGLKVAKAIKREWFSGTTSKYSNKGFQSTIIKNKI